MERIVLKGDAVAGNLMIQAGEYAVTVLTDRSSLQLTGRGVDYLIPAVRRPNRNKASRTISLQFYSLGGGNWSIVMCLPKRGEWIASIAYCNKSGDGGGSGAGSDDKGQVYEIPGKKG
jgi:hypothetical protein